MIRITLGAVVLLATIPGTGSAAELNDPAATADKVSEALENEKDVAAADISVTTHADTIVLSGEVGSSIEAARAVAAAEAAADGARVSSHLDVRPRPDSTVAAMTGARVVQVVQEALRADARTADLGVMVSVDDKQVIGLHGLVPTKAARTAAEGVATKVATPWRVRSHLVVPGN